MVNREERYWLGGKIRGTGDGLDVSGEERGLEGVTRGSPMYGWWYQSSYMHVNKFQNKQVGS